MRASSPARRYADLISRPRHRDKYFISSLSHLVMHLLRESAFPEIRLFRGLSCADIAFRHGARPRARILPQFLPRGGRESAYSLPASEIFHRQRHSSKQKSRARARARVSSLIVIFDCACIGGEPRGRLGGWRGGGGGDDASSQRGNLRDIRNDC